MPPGRSLVYNQFCSVDGDDKRMKCNECDALITKKSSNLEMHLKNAHGKVYSEYGKEKGSKATEKRKAVSETGNNSKQPKISSMLGVSIVMKHCVGLVVNSGRPFNMFDDEDMKSLIKMAKFHSREKTEIYPNSVKDAVEATARAKRDEIRGIITGKIISFPLDMATYRHRSFIGVNVQLFFNGAIRVICLQCREVNEKHTSANIEKWIGEAQREFHISNEQVLALSTDSARNMTRAVDDFINKMSCEEDEASAEALEEFSESLFDADPVKMIDESSELSDDFENLENSPEQEEGEMKTLNSAYRVHCVAHKLQLGINDFLWKNKNNARLVNVAQKLAAKLRNPIVRNMISSAKLNQDILDQKTRWNSTYLMIVRLIELKDGKTYKSFYA